MVVTLADTCLLKVKQGQILKIFCTFLADSTYGNPSHSPIGKHFPNSKYENVKNKQMQLFIFAPAGAKILDLFDSEHTY